MCKPSPSRRAAAPPLPEGEARRGCAPSSKIRTLLGSPFGGAVSRRLTERAYPPGSETVIPKNNSLLPNARRLRREMTPQERKLWYLFLRTYPVKYYKQRIVDNYIVDFYCAAAKLVIELDGSQHFQEQEIAYDAERSEVLASHGLLVLRFSNADINERFDLVCERINEITKERLS